MMSLQSLVALVILGFTIANAAPTATVTCAEFKPTPTVPPAKPKQVIIDTDFLSFTDDAGAIAIANTLQNMGYVNILGIVSDVTSNYSLPGIAAINNWYCNPNIPLAQTSRLSNALREPTVNLSNPEYITQLSNPTIYPEQFDRKSVKDPVQFYTEVLDNADSQSLTIISIGFSTNLYNLYHSSRGPQLIKDKVAELVVQGGSCNTTDNPHGAGYNLIQDLLSAQVLMEWPSPVTFLPGFVAQKVEAGQAALNLPEGNPVRYVYETANFKFKFGPHDMLATYYAIFGLGEGTFKYGNPKNKGGLQFVPDPSSSVAEKQDSVWNDAITPPAAQNFLVLNQPVQTIGEKINNLLSCYDTKPVCGKQ